MSFLMPLYIAGAALVAFPVLFHMLRRTPRGRIPFSSVMFLQPSPPRVTRRSRLENWPLLLLRAAAICLLAAAFARPFLRGTLELESDTQTGRRIVVLLDTSASMRRDGLWEAAIQRVKRVIAKTTPADRVALYTFDRDVQPIVTFEEWSQLAPAARRTVTQDRLAGLTPGWNATDLGRALTSVVDTTHEASGKSDANSIAQTEIVLISDLQVGSELDGLHGFDWPQEVSLTVKRVATKDPTNAGLQLVGRKANSVGDNSDKSIRVRVVNSQNSEREQFQIGWAIDDESKSSTTHEVYVPPGEARVVRIPLPDDATLNPRLVLQGDQHPFDNVAYLARPEREQVTVVYYGSDKVDDSRGAQYYLHRAFPETDQRAVEVLAQDRNAPVLSTLVNNVGLIVVTEPPSDEHLQAFATHMRRGCTLLYVVGSSADTPALSILADCEVRDITEAQVDGYAMLESIDYEHALFAPFADARFSDFTKIRFWKHRHINIENLSQTHTLAKFDDGSPALIELPRDRGRLLILTSSWTPDDSRLALSSKFVPLLNGILSGGVSGEATDVKLAVGDPIRMLPAIESSSGQSHSVVLPDERTIQLTAGSDTFGQTTLPGIYTVTSPSRRVHVAVNLDAAESRTAPLPVETLEEYGVRLTPANPQAVRLVAKNRERQLKNQELENRQSIWRWLIVAALVALFAETWLAARIAQRTTLASNSAIGSQDVA